MQPRDEKSLVVFGLGCENPPVEPANEPRIQTSYLIGPPCNVQGHFIRAG